MCPRFLLGAPEIAGSSDGTAEENSGRDASPDHHPIDAAAHGRHAPAGAFRSVDVLPPRPFARRNSLSLPPGSAFRAISPREPTLLSCKRFLKGHLRKGDPGVIRATQSHRGRAHLPDRPAG